FYLQYKENSKLIDGIFTFDGGTATFRTETRVERIPMMWVSNGMYATLGVRPQLGRLPLSADENHAIVISDALWRDWFGRNPAVVGKWYFASDSMKQIVGVMPRDFHFPDDKTMLWLSGDVRPAQVRPGLFELQIVARMKDGVTRTQLESELTGLAKSLPARFGGPPGYERIIKSYRSV